MSKYLDPQTVIETQEKSVHHSYGDFDTLRSLASSKGKQLTVVVSNGLWKTARVMESKSVDWDDLFQQYKSGHLLTWDVYFTDKDLPTQ